MQVGRLSFNMQLSYFNRTVVELRELLGAAKSATLLAQTLIAGFLGTNDYVHNYLEANSALSAEYNPYEFQTFLASQLKAKIKVCKRSSSTKLCSSTCLSGLWP